jgi:hypothetical protein
MRISKVPDVVAVEVAVIVQWTQPLPSKVAVAVQPTGVPATPVVKLK